MARYHINAQGEAGICHAHSDNCPFGPAEDHFHSAMEARQAYEHRMQSMTETEIARVFTKNLNRRKRQAVEAAIMSTVDELRRERPVDFPEWEGDQASSETVMNMGVRIMMDQVQEASDRGSSTPYTDALESLKKLTSSGALNVNQVSDFNLSQMDHYMNNLINNNTRDRQAR